MNRSARQTEGICWTYVVKETALILLFSYVILVGGTFNGRVLVPLRLVNIGLLALIGVLWLAWRLRRRRPFPSTPLDLPLLGYLGAFAFTAAFSIDPRRSAGAVWELAAYALMFYLMVDLLRQGWPAELFVKVLLIVGAIVLGPILGDLVRWYGKWHAIWGWARPLPAVTFRVGSLIGGPNALAAFVNLLWPLAVTRLTEERRWVPRILLSGWLLTAVLALYSTSSRGGWLGTVGALGTLLLLSARLRQWLQRLIDWLTGHRWRLVGSGLVVLATAGLLAFLLLSQLQHPSHGGRAHLWHSAWIAFRSSPIVGTGPFTYGETYLATHSVPPDGLYSVAHSYPINLAAESGLVGLAALTWVTLALGRTLWLRWRCSSAELQHTAVGALAAVAGFALHSQVDSVVVVPYIPIIVALLLAIVVKDEKRGKHHLGYPHLVAWVLPLGWALLLVAAVWSLRSALVFSRGTAAANRGDWSVAAQWLDEATAQDPEHAYYHLQAGYAHGRHADEESDALTKAIAHYQEGISRSPNYALNAANLSTLYWQAGETEKALAWMERAVNLAPESAHFHLNLGRLHEELEQEAPARRLYRAALDRAPRWADAFYWRATPFRATVKEAWLSARPEPQAVEEPSTAGEWAKAGREALAEARYNEASHAFKRALSLNPHDVSAYVGQAAAYAALGRAEEAERLLRTSLFAAGGGKLHGLRAKLALAELRHEQGRTEEAIRLAEQAIDVARDPTTHTAGFLSYAHYARSLFHSEMIYSSVLPELTVITVTDEVAEWMLELGAWYEERGDPGAAARVYRELLEEVPDSELARKRLAEIDE